MVGSFLAALPCGGKIEERLHRACAGDARGRVNSIKEHAFKDQPGIALLIHKCDLVFLAEGLAGGGEEGSDQQGDGVRAIPPDRMGEHSTGQGLPPASGAWGRTGSRPRITGTWASSSKSGWRAKDSSFFSFWACFSKC